MADRQPWSQTFWAGKTRPISIRDPALIAVDYPLGLTSGLSTYHSGPSFLSLRFRHLLQIAAESAIRVDVLRTRRDVESLDVGHLCSFDVMHARRIPSTTWSNTFFGLRSQNATTMPSRILFIAKRLRYRHALQSSGFRDSRDEQQHVLVLGIASVSLCPSLRHVFTFNGEPREQRVASGYRHEQVRCLEGTPDAPLAVAEVKRVMNPPRSVVIPEMVQRITAVQSNRKKSPRHRAFSDCRVNASRSGQRKPPCCNIVS